MSTLERKGNEVPEGRLIDQFGRDAGPAPERESREWWYADSENMTVTKVLGYSCAPDNPDTWWCPSIGCSITERYHAFSTEENALVVLIPKLKERRDKITVALERLYERLGGVIIEGRQVRGD